jgi:hypothetical protein
MLAGLEGVERSENKNGENIFHAFDTSFSLHNFGLGDRYIEKVVYDWVSEVGSIKTGSA